MRLVLKVILLIIIIVISLFFVGGVFFLIVVQKQNFVTEMLYGLGVSFLGFLSAWFHVKTIKLYKYDKQDKVLPVPSKIFWTLNIGFSGALIALFSWVFYSIFTVFEQQDVKIDSRELTEMIFVFSIPVIIGGFIFFESYYLKQMLKRNVDRKLILEIDDIKGEEVN